MLKNTKKEKKRNVCIVVLRKFNSFLDRAGVAWKNSGVGSKGHKIKGFPDDREHTGIKLRQLVCRGSHSSEICAR